jgi:antitoxin YefM
MDRTNANDFRTNLKEWMEAARSEPVKITRKSGEAFVLVSAEEFEGMRLELASLRGVAQGLSDVVQGRVRKGTKNSLDQAMERAKDRVLGSRTKKKAAV